MTIRTIDRHALSRQQCREALAAHICMIPKQRKDQSRLTVNGIIRCAIGFVCRPESGPITAPCSRRLRMEGVGFSRTSFETEFKQKNDWILPGYT